ncbi:MAG: polysaccharide deacetylase family protein [Eubacterium sp.]|nr:polysaccharide deacetylase family protein [Eubacterium sp.]
MSKLILTIDDIPQSVTVPMVDYLYEKKIPAVFFAVGSNIEKNPAPAIHALKKGFLIGNHSYSHPAFSKLSFAEGLKEICRTEELLDWLYSMAGVPHRIRLFRFPYIDKGGENKEKYQEYLRNNGYRRLADDEVTAEGYRLHKEDQDIACSFDCQEYNIPPGTMTMEDVLERIHKGDPGNGAFVTDDSTQIVLLHSHDDTERLVPGYYRIILDELIQVGGSFVPAGFSGLN